MILPAYITSRRWAIEETVARSWLIQIIAVPSSCARAAHFGQDLRLDRNIQRRGWLIADDQLGLVEQGNGNGDALPHPARELMRMRVKPPCRIGNADSRQDFSGASPGGGFANAAMCLQSEAHLRADGQDRVQRRRRILEHHGDLAATNGPELTRRQPDQFASVQLDRTTDDPPGRINKPRMRSR